MQLLSFKRSAALPLAVCLLFSAPLAMSAQEDGSNGPPKVLVIQREYLKPGKGGSLHEKTESAFVHAMSAAKWPVHYFAMDSLSGPSRSLFFSGYPSFEAWGKDTQDTQNNPTLSAALDRASIADGDLLSAYDSSAWALRDDMSLSKGNLVNMRYLELTVFIVRPGHMKEWEDLVKLYTDGYKKAVPEAHWVTFESMYGVNNGGEFLVITPLKSLAETDRSLGESKQFADSMGEAGMKKLSELSASCLQSSQTNLFAINPKNSYPPDEWIKAEPSFWKPKTAPAAKKPETKPAQ